MTQAAAAPAPAQQAPAQQAPAQQAPADPITPAPAGLGGLAEPAPRPLTYTGPAEGGGTEVRERGTRGRHAANGAKDQEPSRNAPCPCGSGKKYKRCHGAPTITAST
ncbi:MAG TPA: SEC-C metal-binding domain-containing protein [Pseudonocardiaceae bacterium]|nr:SEC-C metal-binding domain-containing protein [Pseudonocardiaceae bacterium]